MTPHEPLELLELLDVVLDDVGADDVQLVQLGDGLAVVGDENVVIVDQGLEIVGGGSAPCQIDALPCALTDDRVGASVR